MTFAGEEKLHFLINNDYYSQLIISAERRSRAAKQCEAAIHVLSKGVVMHLRHLFRRACVVLYC